MAQEPADDGTAHPPSAAKKRRLSEDSHARIKAATQHNATLAHIAVPLQHHQSSPVAFSRDGLVAQQRSQADGQIAIVLAPLSAPCKVKPHLVHAPLHGSYKITRLQFSPCGTSIVAVIQPVEQRLSTSGLVCIWSRDPASSVAINQGWNITAAWPLSPQSTLGSAIIGLHWIDSLPRFLVKQPPQPRSTATAASSTAPQLPGTDPNRPADGVFERVSLPSRGPHFAQRPQPAQGLVLVGSNGMAHLAHRHTAVQQNYPYPPTLAGIYAIKPFTLLSAPLSSPSIAGASTTPMLTDGVLSSVAFHPVAQSNNLLVAGISTDAPRHVTLTLVEITDHLSAIMTTKPMPPIDLDAVQWDNDISADTISHLAFTSAIDAGTSTKKEEEEEERISLVVALTTTPAPNTLLASYSLKHDANNSSHEFLSDAFNNLQSRKKSVDAAVMGASSTWTATLLSTEVVPRRSLAHLSPNALRLNGSKFGSSLRAFWLDGSSRTPSVSIQDIDPPTLKAEEGQHGQAIDPLLPPRPWTFSPHAVLLSGAIDGNAPAPIRATGAPWQSYADTSLQCQSLAASLFEATCNGSSYDDLLLASSSLLASTKNRKAVLQSYAIGRGLNHPPASEVNLPPQWLLQEILTVMLRMSIAVLKTKSKSVADGRLAEQTNKVTWLLDLFHRFSTIYSAKTADDGWDVDSLADLLPTVDALVKQCEAVARDSLLMRKGAAAQWLSSTADSADALSILASHAGIRRILTTSLQLLLDLVSWLGKVNTADSTLATDVVQRKANQLVHDVMLIKSMRKPWASALSSSGSAEHQTWPDASNPVPISGIQVSSSNEQAGAGAATPAMTPSAAGVRSLLSSAHETLAERINTSGINLPVFAHRLASFDGGQTSSRSAIDALTELLFNGEDTTEEKKSALAKHLVPATSNADDHPPLLKRQGLDLVLNKSDYVHSLADIDLSGDSTSAITHDAITSCPLLNKWKTTKVNLITGQRTTYIPTSRQPKGVTANAALGIVAGSLDVDASFNPCAEDSIVAECLTRSGQIRKKWDVSLRRERWWAV